MASHEPVPDDCFLCAGKFSDGEQTTSDHVLPRRWFETPPPPDLPTLKAHFACNNELGAPEERLRNLLVRAYGHNPHAFAQVLDKASRSRQPPPRGERVDFHRESGVVVPGTLVAFDLEDLHAVFRKITRGLFFKAFGRHMVNGAVRVTPLQVDVVEPIMGLFAGLRIHRRGEFAWIQATPEECPDDGVWLFIVFAAGVIHVATGKAVLLRPPPSASGIVIS